MTSTSNLYTHLSTALGLGLGAAQLTWWHVALRGIIVFLVTLVVIRVGDRRFLARLSAFDVVLGFMLASMMARAINGTAAFFPTLAGGFVLVALHRLLAVASFHWDWVGGLIKGRPSVLVEHGVMDRARLRADRISELDLLQEARLNGNVADVAEIRLATMERNGQVSIVRSASRSEVAG